MRRIFWAFAELGFSRVPYTTFRAILIFALNSGRYSHLKNNSPPLPIRGVADSPHHWYAESPTPSITNTESRLLNFLKENSLYWWYGESSSPRTSDTVSRRLPISLIRRVNDSAYCLVGESTTQRIGDTGSRYSKKKLICCRFSELLTAKP
jgi:hypothetical protein